MRKKIITKASVIIIICVVIALTAMAITGCSQSDSYTEVTHTANEQFTSITIESTTADIIIEKSESGECYAICDESEKFTFSLSVKDDTLKLSENDGRGWYEHFGITFAARKATLYLPDGIYSKLDVKISSGNVKCNTDITFADANIIAASGSIEFSASVQNDLSLESASGNIKASNIFSKNVFMATLSGNVSLSGGNPENAEITTSSGNIELSDINSSVLTLNSASGKIKLEDTMTTNNTTAKTNSGDISFIRCDSANFEFETSSGSVKGIILTDKIFDVRSTSGNIDYPISIEGHGRCNVKTSSGNVKIEIA